MRMLAATCKQECSWHSRSLGVVVVAPVPYLEKPIVLSTKSTGRTVYHVPASITWRPSGVSRVRQRPWADPDPGIEFQARVPPRINEETKQNGRQPFPNYGYGNKAQRVGRWGRIKPFYVFSPITEVAGLLFKLKIKPDWIGSRLVYDFWKPVRDNSARPWVWLMYGVARWLT